MIALCSRRVQVIADISFAGIKKKYFLGNVSTFAHERTPVRAIMLTCKHFISGDQIQVIGRWAQRGFIITPTTTRIIASEICGPWINYTRLSMGAFITAQASRPIHAQDQGSRARLGFLQKMWKLNELQARPRRTRRGGGGENPTAHTRRPEDAPP